MNYKALFNNIILTFALTFFFILVAFGTIGWHYSTDRATESVSERMLNLEQEGENHGIESDFYMWEGEDLYASDLNEYFLAPEVSGNDREQPNTIKRLKAREGGYYDINVLEDDIFFEGVKKKRRVGFFGFVLNAISDISFYLDAIFYDYPTKVAHFLSYLGSIWTFYLANFLGYRYKEEEEQRRKIVMYRAFPFEHKLVHKSDSDYLILRAHVQRWNRLHGKEYEKKREETWLVARAKKRVEIFGSMCKNLSFVFIYAVLWETQQDILKSVWGALWQKLNLGMWEEFWNNLPINYKVVGLLAAIGSCILFWFAHDLFQTIFFTAPFVLFFMIYSGSKVFFTEEALKAALKSMQQVAQRGDEDKKLLNVGLALVLILVVIYLASLDLWIKFVCIGVLGVIYTYDKTWFETIKNAANERWQLPPVNNLRSIISVVGALVLAFFFFPNLKEFITKFKIYIVGFVVLIIAYLSRKLLLRLGQNFSSNLAIETLNKLMILCAVGLFSLMVVYAWWLFAFSDDGVFFTFVLIITCGFAWYALQNKSKGEAAKVVGICMCTLWLPFWRGIEEKKTNANTDAEKTNSGPQKETTENVDANKQKLGQGPPTTSWMPSLQLSKWRFPFFLTVIVSYLTYRLSPRDSPVGKAVQASINRYFGKISKSTDILMRIFTTFFDSLMRTLPTLFMVFVLFLATCVWFMYGFSLILLPYVFFLLLAIIFRDIEKIETFLGALNDNQQSQEMEEPVKGLSKNISTVICYCWKYTIGNYLYTPFYALLQKITMPIGGQRFIVSFSWGDALFQTITMILVIIFIYTIIKWEILSFQVALTIWLLLMNATAGQPIAYISIQPIFEWLQNMPKGNYQVFEFKLLQSMSEGNVFDVAFLHLVGFCSELLVFLTIPLRAIMEFHMRMIFVNIGLSVPLVIKSGVPAFFSLLAIIYYYKHLSESRYYSNVKYSDDYNRLLLEPYNFDVVSCS